MTINPADLDLSQIQAELQTRSMHEFIKGAWDTIEPGREFHDNWHIEAICEHLEAVSRGELNRLIINIPPRHMKSLTCAVAFPTWTWIHSPNKQFLFASYSKALSTRDNVKCRRLLSSPWYQKNWGDRFQLTTDQNQKSRFENNHNGHRIATSVSAGLTGDGGDIIVIDDPHNVKEAESVTVREDTLEWFDTAVPTRLNDQITGAFVIIMQRVHENDLTGHILAKSSQDWTHLCVPAEYDTSHPHIYTSTLKNPVHKKDPRKEDDELLWPARFPKDILQKLKSDMGSYAAAGQLQQRPAPKGGGILKRKWWRKWEHSTEPEFVYVLQSWDTAYSERDNRKASYSACTTWGVFTMGGRYCIMIMHRWRDKLGYPDLRRKAKELHDEYAPDAILVEKKASGQSLIQDLRQMGLTAIPYTPDRDKVSRAHVSSSLLEAGIVWYPDRRWAEEVIHQCAVFPSGDGTDVVDTVTQALIRLRAMWYAEPEEDSRWTPTTENRIDPNDNVVPLRTGAPYG
tara:strand:- start:1345 stop:2883 length:1539 start_codon:yes stop_codon:yes gene_type:complete